MKVSEARKETARRMGDGGQDERLPCRSCDAPTLRETLSQYGARCFRCYEAYCLCAPPAPKITAVAIIPEGHRAWAYRLRARLDGGEQLGPAQRECLAVFEGKYGAARIGADQERRYVAPEDEAA